MKMEWSLMFCTSEVYRDSISRLASSAWRRSVVSSMARRMNSVWLSFPQMRRALRSMYFRPMAGKTCSTSKSSNAVSCGKTSSSSFRSHGMSHCWLPRSYTSRSTVSSGVTRKVR